MLNNQAPAARRNNMIGNPTIGSYRTPDGVGHIQRIDSKKWEAWRDDLPGVTAEYRSMKHAAQYAHFGYSDGDH